MPILEHSVVMDQKAPFNSDSKELPIPPQPLFAVPSAAGPPAPLFRTPLACITLNYGDRIRFINLPEPVVAVLRAVVQSTWPKGIQKIAPYGESVEFKLNGWPWHRTSTATGYDHSRRILIKILETLYDRGWVLHSAIDMTKRESDPGACEPKQRDCPLP